MRSTKGRSQLEVSTIPPGTKFKGGMEVNPFSTLKICHFTRKNGSAIYFCRATCWIQDDLINFFY